MAPGAEPLLPARVTRIVVIDASVREGTMPIRSILVPFWPNAGTHVLEVAARLAVPMGAAIDVRFIRSDTRLALIGVMPELTGAGVNFDLIDREAAAAGAQARQAFEAWRERHGLPNEEDVGIASASWTETTGEIEGIVERDGRLADLIVTARPETPDSASNRAFEGAVFGSGRPTLMVPPAAPCDLFEHVLVTWNGSLEATHAVAQSLDLIVKAGRVSVLQEPADGEDPPPLEPYLRRHGIIARRVQATAAPGGVGPTILATIQTVGATLLVRGAFTRSRLRQALFGGITRHVVQQSKVAVLFAH
jgi:nucleotide-binding universal stress UspA family protein